MTVYCKDPMQTIAYKVNSKRVSDKKLVDFKNGHITLSNLGA